jgi:hypothetical protein
MNLFRLVALLATLGFVTMVYVVNHQNAVIADQQEVIRVMIQNPACEVAPTPKHTFDGDPRKDKSKAGSQAL